METQNAFACHLDKTNPKLKITKLLLTRFAMFVMSRCDVTTFVAVHFSWKSSNPVIGFEAKFYRVGCGRRVSTRAFIARREQDALQPLSGLGAKRIKGLITSINDETIVAKIALRHHVSPESVKAALKALRKYGWPLTGDMLEYQSLALIEAGYRIRLRHIRG